VKFKAVKSFASLKPAWLTGLKDAFSQHQTLRVLDVSANPVGDDGQWAIQEIVSSNPQLSSLGFDGIEVSSPPKLIELFNFLAHHQGLKKVKRPKKEIERLTAKCGHKAGLEMKAMWKRLHAQIAGSRPSQTSHTTEDLSTDASTVGTTDTTSVSRLSFSVAQTVSWTYDLPAPNDPYALEWESLRRKFSYETITGVVVAPKHVRAASSPSTLVHFSDVDLA
jgi:hypothetical protein